MYICEAKDSELWLKFKRVFTVKNKNIEKLERIQWRSLPYLRHIQLYKNVGAKIYVPPGKFSNKLKRTLNLSERITYTGTTEWLPADMKDMLEEQEIILNSIEFEGKRTWLIEMKTARGKWNLLIQMIEKFQEPTLILVHSIKTLNELKKKFEDFSDYEPWVYYSKKKDIKEITITTHKSFVDKTELFRSKFWIVIMDECDTNISPKMTGALATVDCDGLFGLTWTPERADLDINDMQLIFGDLIKVKNQKNNWYNMIPDIYRLGYVNNRIFSFEDFRDLQNQLMEDELRILAQTKAIQKNMEWRKLWLLLIDRIRECTIYKEMLDSVWIECAIVNWDTKEEDDEKNIEYLKSVNGVIIWTSKKMYRWVDIPQIDTIFLFYPNRFHATIIQSVGRWLRSFPWKTDVKLYDWGDLPTLKWQAYDRLTAYQKEYPNVQITDIAVIDED